MGFSGEKGPWRSPHKGESDPGSLESERGVIGEKWESNNVEVGRRGVDMLSRCIAGRVGVEWAAGISRGASIISKWLLRFRENPGEGYNASSCLNERGVRGE